MFLEWAFIIKGIKEAFTNEKASTKKRKKGKLFNLLSFFSDSFHDMFPITTTFIIRFVISQIIKQKRRMVFAAFTPLSLTLKS
jgi:hypothetical protein